MVVVELGGVMGKAMEGSDEAEQKGETPGASHNHGSQQAAAPR